MSHNGEINTLRGNTNWMFARQGVVKSELFGDELPKLFPIVEPDCSDSGTFDNVLEFLLMSGRTLQESVMMMVPEAWQNHETMPEDKRAFYEYNSCLMEPWDGPASIAFTDGKYIGAVLDRNGLRPSRYYLTHDDRVIMASEVGVLRSIKPENVKAKGRLQPGRMFLVDFEQGRLIPDDELKHDFAGRRPVRQVAQEAADRPQRPAPRGPAARLQAAHAARADAGLRLHGRDDELHAAADDQGREGPHRLDGQRLVPGVPQRQAADAVRLLPAALRPGHQPRDRLDSRGSDHVAGVLHRPRAESARNDREARPPAARAASDSVERADGGAQADQPPRLALAEDRHHLAARAKARRAWSRRSTASAPRPKQAVDDGETLIVLTDRAISTDRVPLSSLLATGAVHHHLVRKAKRTRIGIIVETGEAREVHHHCLLVGYGADAINPYLAFESLWQARRDGLLDSGEEGIKGDESGEGDAAPGDRGGVRRRSATTPSPRPTTSW